VNRKYFFFDIDNTLAVWPDGTIPESAQYSLQYLQDTGHHVALATGRLQADAMRFAKMAKTPKILKKLKRPLLQLTREATNINVKDL